MANQPKKYKKFVATAATATLVASAIVPVASAASYNDVSDSNDHKANIDKISELGYMGAGDSFNPGGNLTRGQVAIILANWAKDAAGLEVPADYKTAQRFEDVALTADDKLLQSAALVFDNEIFSGSNGNLLPGNEITRLQMALVLNKAYGSVTGTTLVELAGDTSDVEIGDLDQIPAEHQGVVKALKKLGITAPANFNPNGKVTRGQFASFFISTIEAEAAEVKVNSVTAVGASKIEVKFNGAVATDKAKFTVKKGSINVNASKVEFAEDKKSAIITLSTKLTKGDYNVEVAGVSEETVSKTISVESEKVDKVEFTTDKLVLNATDASKATIGYKVSNQYGEDITNTTSGLTFSVGVTLDSQNQNPVSYSNGVLSIDADANLTLDSKVAVSVVHASSGVFTSTIATVSPKAQVADVEISALYNSNNAEILDVNATAGNFKLVIDAKDQYGNSVAANNIANDVVVTVSNTAVVNIAGGAASPSFTTTNVDGTNKVTLALAAPNGGLTAGTSVITIISKSTGDIAKYTVEVKASASVDEFTLSAPALAVAGEEVEIPFTAVDQFGNAISKATVLNNGFTSFGISNQNASVTFEQDYVTGKAKLVLDATNVQGETTVYITAVTKTGKVVQLPVTLLAPAKPAVVTSTKNLTTTLANGASISLTPSNLVAKDQYGRDITPTLGSNNGEYRYVVETGSASKVAISGQNDNVIEFDGNVTTATLNAVAKGSSTFTVKLQKTDGNNWTDVENSAYTFNVNVVEKADITSYEVADLNKLYYNTTANGYNAHTSEVVVNGLLADGTKVVVPASYYTVTENITGVAYSAQTNVLTSDGQFVFGNNGADVEGTGTIIVTVDGANGAEVITKTVTVSKVGAAPTTTSLVTNGLATKESDGVVSVTLANLKSASVAQGSTADLENLDLQELAKDAIKVVDQYGIEISETAASYTVIPTNLPSGKTLATLAQGDTFNLTAITSNGKVVTFKVILK